MEKMRSKISELGYHAQLKCGDELKIDNVKEDTLYLVVDNGEKICLIFKSSYSFEESRDEYEFAYINYYSEEERDENNQIIVKGDVIEYFSPVRYASAQKILTLVQRYLSDLEWHYVKEQFPPILSLKNTNLLEYQKALECVGYDTYFGYDSSEDEILFIHKGGRVVALYEKNQQLKIAHLSALVISGQIFVGIEQIPTFTLKVIEKYFLKPFDLLE